MDDRLTNRLEMLVTKGILKSYKLTNVDENGVVDKFSDNRNTEQLTMNFPSGDTLVIRTFCSGSAENTVLLTED